MLLLAEIKLRKYFRLERLSHFFSHGVLHFGMAMHTCPILHYGVVGSQRKWEGGRESYTKTHERQALKNVF